MSSAKWRPFCLGLYGLNNWSRWHGDLILGRKGSGNGFLRRPNSIEIDAYWGSAVNCRHSSCKKEGFYTNGVLAKRGMTQLKQHRHWLIKGVPYSCNKEILSCWIHFRRSMFAFSITYGHYDGMSIWNLSLFMLLKLGNFNPTYSIPWLLMTWWHKEPGH